jgi:hypothetical protein
MVVTSRPRRSRHRVRSTKMLRQIWASKSCGWRTAGRDRRYAGEATVLREPASQLGRPERLRARPGGGALDLGPATRSGSLLSSRDAFRRIRLVRRHGLRARALPAHAHCSGGTMKTLEGKVALVTGSSRGIGATTATLFGRHGARVCVHGRDHEATAAVVKNIQDEGGAPTGACARKADRGPPHPPPRDARGRGARRAVSRLGGGVLDHRCRTGCGRRRGNEAMIEARPKLCPRSAVQSLSVQTYLSRPRRLRMKEQIISKQEELDEAELKADRDALDMLLADDFVCIGPKRRRSVASSGPNV